MSYNLRMIPTGEYLKKKKTEFLLYIKLQQISFWNEGENHRYIPIHKVNKTLLAKELHSNHSRITNKLKSLEDDNLIKFVETDTMDYYILPNEHDYYVTLSLETIQLLLDCCKEHITKVYLKHKAYHYLYCIKGNQTHYYLSREQLAEECGLNINSLKRITNANRILEEMGILEIITEYRKIDGEIKKINCYKVLK